MILARLRHGNLSTLTVTSFYVISTQRNGPTSICILGQMACSKNGKNCFLVVLTNMHHSNWKESIKAKCLHALRVIYYVKPEEEILLKISQSGFQWFSHVGSILKTGQITQLGSQKDYISDDLEANKGNLRKTWWILRDRSKFRGRGRAGANMGRAMVFHVSTKRRVK